MKLTQSKLYKKLTPYKQFENDGYCIEWCWWFSHRYMDQKRLLSLAKMLNKCVKVDTNECN